MSLNATICLHSDVLTLVATVIFKRCLKDTDPLSGIGIKHVNALQLTF